MPPFEYKAANPDPSVLSESTFLTASRFASIATAPLNSPRIDIGAEKETVMPAMPGSIGTTGERIPDFARIERFLNWGFSGGGIALL
ncbi:MAG: hypothetical protein Q8M76_09995 [Spirochaetaceae bacterium]|nr:hypothetical protein [Spirochaetaceae bacterium]